MTIEPPSQSPVSRAVRECAAPIALLVGIHAVYVALTLALPRWVGIGDLPAALTAMSWGYGIALTAALFWLLARVGAIAERLLLAGTERWSTAWDNLVLPVAGRALRRLLPLAAIGLGILVVPLPPLFETVARKLTVLVLIAATAWLLVHIVDVAVAVVRARHPITDRGNLQARAIHTQVVVLQKIANTIIAIFTLASMLMVFDTARQFGASILASAGIAGIVVGLAAQRSIGTLLAGFQIALTQPIRVGDSIVVEGESGEVEEITLTYVVVRVWDNRRLIVPITAFIEKPFQNWTRASPELLATVHLHVDYTVRVEDLRAELTRILTTSKYWDGRTNVLQVTEARERTLELRALVSAANAGLAWDLRCEVREKLVDYLQREHARSLPQLRAVVQQATAFAPEAEPRLLTNET